MEFDPSFEEREYGGDASEIIVPEDCAVFATFDNDYGITAPPIPSHELEPEWGEGECEDGIRDALNLGWVMRMPVKVQIQYSNENGLNVSDSYDRDTVGTHHPEQMEGYSFPFVILKMMAWWSGHLPDGYSALLTEPFACRDPRHTPFSGVIDYDNFPTVSHMPGILEEDGHHIFAAGKPIGQVIPFKRDEMPRTASIREATEEELEELNDGSPRSDREAFKTTIEHTDVTE